LTELKNELKFILRPTNQGIKGILKGTEPRSKGDSDDDIAKQKSWDTLNDKANGRMQQTNVGSEGNFPCVLS
jgi:hypothetical protein